VVLLYVFSLMMLELC